MHRGILDRVFAARRFPDQGGAALAQRFQGFLGLLHADGAAESFAVEAQGFGVVEAKVRARSSIRQWSVWACEPFYPKRG
jgi:hypothetical protein